MRRRDDDISGRLYRVGLCYRATVIVTGAMCAGLGIAVLIALATGRIQIARAMPGSPTMPPGSAVGFLICGAGLVGIGMWYPVAAATMAVAAAAFGAVVASGCLFGNAAESSALAEAARIAPNTVFCFLLSGVALFTRHVERQRPGARTAVAVMGSAVFAVGLTSLIGYATGNPLYAWSSRTPMSFLSSIGCSLLGLGVIMSVWRYSDLNERGTPFWYSVALIAGAAAVVASVAAALAGIPPASRPGLRSGAGVGFLLACCASGILAVARMRRRSRAS